jgi:hypothetical protein
MVIIVINNICITINKLKKYSPIAGNFHCIKSFFISALLVMEGSRVFHILDFTCGIETIKDPFKPVCVFRLYSFFASRAKKILQPFMFKGFYHGTLNVTLKVTLVNIILVANDE